MRKFLLVLIFLCLFQTLAFSRVYLLGELGTYKFNSDASNVTTDTSFVNSKMKNSSLPFSYGIGTGVEFFSDYWISFCAEGVYLNSFRSESSDPPSDTTTTYNTYLTKIRTHSFEGRGDVGINFKAGGLRIRPFFGIGSGRIHSSVDFNYSSSVSSVQTEYYTGLKDKADLQRTFVGVGFYDEKLKLGSRIVVGKQSLSNRNLTAKVEDGTAGARASLAADGTYSMKLDSYFLNLDFLFLF